MEVHGEVWTLKELFVYPNEFIYWSIQIVLYPFMTGLVAGAFVLSSLYHVFGRKELKEIAAFSLLFSFALLLAAPMPLMLHLQQPQRGTYVFFTPHFTSAIAAFGIVFFSYSTIVASEIWFVNRKYFVEAGAALRSADSAWQRFRGFVLRLLSLGATDISEPALHTDHKVAKVLAGVGIPTACFLHGYAGFIFGSVKANALWMTPLMPVIFIMSAIVSGIALCMLTYIVIMEFKKFMAKRARRPGMPPQEIAGAEVATIKITVKYLIGFMVAAITLELLDLVFRGYTAVKSWDILRNVIYDMDFTKIFVLQYGIGNLLPFVMLLLPRLTIRRTVVALMLVIFGVFMMRWNVVIGGQSFSLTFSGFMHYELPIVPHNLETFKEGLGGLLLILGFPFAALWVTSLFIPVVEAKKEEPSH
jgi:predicted membrane protein